MGRSHPRFSYLFKVKAIHSRYWLTCGLQDGDGWALGIISNVLPHSLSDCVGLERRAVVSSIKVSITEPSGAVRGDLALSLRRNLCAWANRI